MCPGSGASVWRCPHVGVAEPTSCWGRCERPATLSEALSCSLGHRRDGEEASPRRWPASRQPACLREPLGCCPQGPFLLAVLTRSHSHRASLGRVWLGLQGGRVHGCPWPPALLKGGWRWGGEGPAGRSCRDDLSLGLAAGEGTHCSRERRLRGTGRWLSWPPPRLTCGPG